MHALQTQRVESQAVLEQSLKAMVLSQYCASVLVRTYICAHPFPAFLTQWHLPVLLNDPTGSYLVTCYAHRQSVLNLKICVGFSHRWRSNLH